MQIVHTSTEVDYKIESKGTLRTFKEVTWLSDEQFLQCLSFDEVHHDKRNCHPLYTYSSGVDYTDYIWMTKRCQIFHFVHEGTWFLVRRKTMASHFCDVVLETKKLNGSADPNRWGSLV